MQSRDWEGEPFSAKMSRTYFTYSLRIIYLNIRDSKWSSERQNLQRDSWTNFRNYAKFWICTAIATKVESPMQRNYRVRLTKASKARFNPSTKSDNIADCRHVRCHVNQPIKKHIRYLGAHWAQLANRGYIVHELSEPVYHCLKYDPRSYLTLHTVATDAVDAEVSPHIFARRIVDVTIPRANIATRACVRAYVNSVEESDYTLTRCKLLFRYNRQSLVRLIGVFCDTRHTCTPRSH